MFAGVPTPWPIRRSPRCIVPPRIRWDRQSGRLVELVSSFRRRAVESGSVVEDPDHQNRTAPKPRTRASPMATQSNTKGRSTARHPAKPAACVRGRSVHARRGLSNFFDYDRARQRPRTMDRSPQRKQGFHHARSWIRKNSDEELKSYDFSYRSTKP